MRPWNLARWVWVDDWREKSNQHGQRIQNQIIGKEGQEEWQQSVGPAQVSPEISNERLPLTHGLEFGGPIPAPPEGLGSAGPLLWI